MSENQIVISQNAGFRMKTSMSETMFENPVIEADVQKHFQRTDGRSVTSVVYQNTSTAVTLSAVGGGIGGLIVGLTLVPDFLILSIGGLVILAASGGFAFAHNKNKKFRSRRGAHAQKTQQLRILTEKALRRWLFVEFDVIPVSDQRWEKIVSTLMNYNWREHPGRLQFSTTLGEEGELSASNRFNEDEPTYWTLYQVENPHKKSSGKRIQVWTGSTRKSYEEVLGRIHKLTYQQLSPEDEHVLERAIKEAQEITDLIVSLNTVGKVSEEDELVVVKAFAGLKEELDELLHQEGSAVKKNLRQVGQFISDRKADRSQKKGFVLQPSTTTAEERKRDKENVFRFRRK